jgi:hypothetical protein
MQEKKEEMEGMGWRAKSRCACGCSPNGHAASTRGMKCEKQLTVAERVRREIRGAIANS